MRSSLSLGFVLLAGFLAGGPAHASFFFSDEHLDLLEQQVVVEDGVAVFTGLIENTQPSRSIAHVSVYVVLKDAEGLILDIVQGFPDDSLTDITPGEQLPYEVKTPYEESDFDTYTLRVEGVLSFQYDLLRVVDDIATGVEETSWGQIKSHAAEEIGQ